MLNFRTQLLRVKRNTVNTTVYENLFLLKVFLTLFLRNGIMEDNMIYSCKYDVNSIGNERILIVLLPIFLVKKST